MKTPIMQTVRQLRKRGQRARKLWTVACLLGAAATNRLDATDNKMESRLKDIATIEGVRENPLVGYGMVVGLKGTGDSQQTVFSMQTLANIMLRMGLQVPAASITAKNVAAVFVTATLPPFAHPGTHIDVTISSTGDAKSLQGGLLLMTPLTGGDSQVYAVAQGPLTLGGYSAGSNGST